MKSRIYILALAVLTALTMIGCRKDPLELRNPNDPNYRPKTYVEQFEIIWQGIDNGYLFWGRDTTDWDAVYERLLPRFQQFDADGGTSMWQYAEAYNDMVGSLIDHHFTMYVQDPVRGGVAVVQPGAAEVVRRSYYHSTPMEDQVSVLRRRSDIVESAYNSNRNTTRSWYAKIKQPDGRFVLYFRLEGFQMSNLIYRTDSTVQPMMKFYGTKLDGFSNASFANAYPDRVAGIIYDVRGNGGGYVAELTPLIGAFSAVDRQFGYSRIKEGLGRLDYSVWSPFVLKSPTKHLNHEYPIVVLADCNSVSCAEITTQFIKSLPNGTFIGERTWGGTCMLMPGQHDVLYSGVFGELGKNGYYVYTSNFDMVLNDFSSLEGVGVEPDIWCGYDATALSRGIDNQLERALEFIREGR